MMPARYKLARRWSWIVDSPEYALISQIYGDLRAKRSQVPLMNHIDEGVEILSAITPSGGGMAKLAFCLHPVVQNDINLAANLPRLARAGVSTVAVALAMEYRAVANAHLSHHTLPPGGIRLSRITEVNLMLIADKVQNRKDFIRYHRGTHPRSERLDAYFQEWLCALGVSEAEYQALASLVAP